MSIHILPTVQGLQYFSGRGVVACSNMGPRGRAAEVGLRLGTRGTLEPAMSNPTLICIKINSPHVHFDPSQNKYRICVLYMQNPCIILNYHCVTQVETVVLYSDLSPEMYLLSSTNTIGCAGTHTYYI